MVLLFHRYYLLLVVVQQVQLVELLGNWGKITLTYAGGVHSFADLEKLYKLGNNKLNVTIGSALDLFGGDMSYKEVLDYCKKSSEIK